MKNTDKTTKTASAPETRIERDCVFEHGRLQIATASVPEYDMTQTRTEQSVNWHKAFCPVCQPIVDGHFIKREHEWSYNAEQYRATIERLSHHADKLAEALRLALAFCENDAMNRPKINPMASISKALAAYEKEAR